MTKRRLLLGLGLAACLGVAGAVFAVGRLSYTEPNPTGSLARAPIVLLPEASREPAPTIAFTDGQGRAMDLAAFAGKPLLVNLWATWCPPCIAEMPALDKLAGRMAAKGFPVVAVSLDRGGAKVSAAWLEKSGLKALPVYNADPAAFASAQLPTSWLIDGRGRVAWMGLGGRPWDGKEAEAAVEKLLAER